MSNKPEKTYKREKNGTKLVYWGKGRYSVDKSYFKKDPQGDSGEWVKTSTLFDKDLDVLAELIAEAKADREAPEENLLDNLPKAESQQVPFDDDDIPF